MKYRNLTNLGMDMFSESIQRGMPVAGWLNDSSPGRVKMKADFSFENKYQNNCLWSLPRQKIAKTWTVTVEAYSEKENS